MSDTASKPFNKEENEINNLLIDAWNKLNQLEQTHPNHLLEFCNGIHMCQSVLTHRIVQRDYPDVFPTHNVKGGK